MRKFSVLALILLFMIGLPTSAQDTTDYRNPADLADVDGKFMTVDDISVYYLDRGPVEGTPVIMLHGFLGSVIDWTRTIPALTDAGYRVIAFDRPPFGLSDKRTSLDYSNKAMSRLTAHVMDALNIETAVIVGHSLGGTVAAQFVLDYPARAIRLVLVDGAVGIFGSDPQFTMRPPASTNSDANRGGSGIDWLQRVNPDSEGAQALVRGMFTPDFATNLMSQTEAAKRNIDPQEMQLRVRGLRVKGWEGGILAFARDAFTDDSEIDIQQFNSVQTPVLIVWGEDDHIVPLKVGEALRDVFPHNTWITYPEVGHTPMDETTAQFNTDLVAFIAGESP